MSLIRANGGNRFGELSEYCREEFVGGCRDVAEDVFCRDFSQLVDRRHPVSSIGKCQLVAELILADRREKPTVKVFRLRGKGMERRLYLVVGTNESKAVRSYFKWQQGTSMVF